MTVSATNQRVAYELPRRTRVPGWRRLGPAFPRRPAGLGSAGMGDTLRDSALPKVMVDGTQLEIVIYNLVTNSLDAFDAVAPRRSLTGRVEITAETRGADVLINVDDSGPGIAAEVSGRLFDPFVSSKAKGMGLGLSLSRTLLRHQGGDLWSEASRLGGARFVLRLPTEPATQVSL